MMQPVSWDGAYDHIDWVAWTPALLSEWPLTVAHVGASAMWEVIPPHPCPSALR
jgi:hypothetical protein